MARMNHRRVGEMEFIIHKFSRTVSTLDQYEARLRDFNSRMDLTDKENEDKLLKMDHKIDT